MKIKLNCKVYPKNGDIKIKKRFAIFPKLLDDRNLIWLEFYWIKYVYYYPSKGTNWHKHWSTIDQSTF